MIFEYSYNPARPYRDMYFVPRGVAPTPYAALPLHYSLFQLLPYTLNIKLFRYVKGNQFRAL